MKLNNDIFNGYFFFLLLREDNGANVMTVSKKLLAE